MGLSLTDIRDAGLLELYVIGELAPSQRQQVEEAIRTYPELKVELAEIEQALKHFAFAKTVPPAPSVLEKTLTAIHAGPNPPVPPRSGGGSNLSGMFGALALGLASLAGYFWFQSSNVETALVAAQTELEACIAKQEDTRGPIALLEDLQRKDNQVVTISATEKYPETSIFIYNNPATERNYLALGELPELGPDESFQLWSLKADTDPIPLTVFDDSETIVPVSFEQGTGTYAITIERKGGAQTPNLTQLIGTFGMAG